MQAVDLIGFPGEIMLRLLKMLVLPLVSVSMVAGVVSLRQADGGGGGGESSVRRLAHLTAAFYIGGCMPRAPRFRCLFTGLRTPGARPSPPARLPACLPTC